MEINQENLNQMAFILRSIADDLESSGTEGWDSLNDVISSTNNVSHDFNGYKKEVEKSTSNNQENKLC